MLHPKKGGRVNSNTWRRSLLTANVAMAQTAAQIVRRRCRNPGWNLLPEMLATELVLHETPVAPLFGLSRCYSLMLPECWQRSRARCYIDLSLFSASGARGKPAGERSDPTLRRSFAGKCGWPCAAAPAAPESDTACCGSGTRGHKRCRDKRQRRMPALDRLSGEIRLAGRPCLSEGRARQAGADHGSL